MSRSRSGSFCTRALCSPAFATKALHAGAGPDPATGAILTPIHQSTTFVQEVALVDGEPCFEHRGFTYTRSGNPTVAALEERLGALEAAPPAVCFSTGMAAISGLFLSLLRAGDRVLVSEVVYGGTVRLLRRFLAGLGIEAVFVDTADLAAVSEALATQTRLVLIESPGNPTLRLADITAVAAAAHDAGALLAVDNTFLTAALQQPLELGADVSVYSTTKYVEGHNATVGGALVTREARLLERFRLAQGTLGAPQSPFEAWLTLRGIGTLALRMRAHSEGALTVARFLEAHPLVRRVAYPGLASFPQRALAQRQQKGFGGMIAFELEGGAAAGIALLGGLRLCSLAENLGAVQTLVTHPASMTHGSLEPEERARLGIHDGLVRLSVGLEDAADIIADLEQALDSSTVDAAVVSPIGGAR